MYKVRIEGLLLRNQAAKSESSLDKVETYKMASSSLLVCLYIDIIPYRYNVYGLQILSSPISLGQKTKCCVGIRSDGFATLR